MESVESTLTELLFRKESICLMGGSYVVLETILRLLPKGAKDHPVMVRLTPVLPIILCSVGVWIPGMFPDAIPLGERLMTGLILGYALAHNYKIVMQSVFSKDERLKGKKSADGEKAPE